MDGVKDMRSLLKLYMACSKYTLMEDQDFQSLLIEDGGVILGDFFDMMKQSAMDETQPWQNDGSNDMESIDEVESYETSRLETLQRQRGILDDCYDTMRQVV